MMKEKKPTPAVRKKRADFSDNYKYPASDDIYNKFKEEPDIDPEDTSKNKEVLKIEKSPKWNEKDFQDDVTGADLDVPGAELDDEAESIGSEDEENNSYSIGGDNHNDLEESKE